MPGASHSTHSALRVKRPSLRVTLVRLTITSRYALLIFWCVLGLLGSLSYPYANKGQHFYLQLFNPFEWSSRLPLFYT